MATVNTLNGNPQRKQLSEQIDRLDTLLDGLSEGLNEAVTDAVREGTRLALKDAIVEIMTDPALRAKLHEATAPKLEKKPGFWARFKARLAATGRLLRGALGALVRGVTSASATATGAFCAVASIPIRWLGLIASAKDVLGIGACAGFIFAAVALAAPHEVAAVLSGISGAIAAMSLRTAHWMRRAFGALPLI
jgi:hypothetical protein